MNFMMGLRMRSLLFQLAVGVILPTVDERGLALRVSRDPQTRLAAGVVR